MNDLHINEFYQDAGRVLTALLGVFPRPVPIYVEDISGPDEPDEYGVHSSRHQACFATLLWLGEEGYLRYDEPIKQEAIDQAVLTGRCFTALLSSSELSTPTEPNDLPPSIAEERASLGFQLKEAVYGKDSAALNRAMTTLLRRMTPSIT